MLNSARNALFSRDPQVRLAQAQKLRTARVRLEAIQHSAIAIANEVHRLAEFQPRLLAEARAVVAALTTVEQAAVMPVQLPQHAPIVRAAAWEIQRLAEQQPSGSSDEMRQRHNRLLGLERDIIAGKAAINHVDALRTTLLDLLSQPELAVDPAWLDAIAALCRIRQTSDDPTRTQRLAALHASADELQRRLHLLHDGALQAQVPLDESRLLALVAEARAIQDAVRTLWQRARAVNQVPKPDAKQGAVS